jgi:hypothetical protein
MRARHSWSRLSENNTSKFAKICSKKGQTLRAHFANADERTHANRLGHFRAVPILLSFL